MLFSEGLFRDTAFRRCFHRPASHHFRVPLYSEPAGLFPGSHLAPRFSSALALALLQGTPATAVVPSHSGVLLSTVLGESKAPAVFPSGFGEEFRYSAAPVFWFFGCKELWFSPFSDDSLQRELFKQRN